MLHLKYEFPNEAKWDELKTLLSHEYFDTEDADGNEISEFQFMCEDTIAVLGELQVTPAEFDEDGNLVSEPVMSGKFHVDILWIDSANEPAEFVEYQIQLNDFGIHGFAGVQYIFN